MSVCGAILAVPDVAGAGKLERELVKKVLFFPDQLVMNRLVLTCLVLAATRLAAADTVELSGGGHLSGEVTRDAESRTVAVQLDDDLRVFVPEKRVLRSVESSRLKPYLDALEQVGDDPQRHYQLGVWCMKVEGFPGEAAQYKRYHMLRAIELDPDHAEARGNLEYIKNQKGQWIQKADLMKKRGMVYYRRQWQLPEAVVRMKAEDEAAVAAKRWVKEVGRQTAVIIRGSSKSADALAVLNAIEDPLASDAIAQQLDRSRGSKTQNRSLRLLWVKLLGRFKTSRSVRALVKAGIDEPDSTVREAALKELQVFGATSAVATYLPMLKSKDNALINRAARALSWFPDPELAMTYTEALVTTHNKEIVQGGGGTQAGFSQDGGGSFSQGSKKIVIPIKKQNPAVLSLLTTIEPDQNFSYNEKAWRSYFASKLTSYDGDLRRDP